MRALSGLYPVRDRHARGPILIGIGATLAALIGLGWYTAVMATVTSENADRALKIENLRTTIIYLDEVLTMSSRMAAETGDLRWETRYRKFEPELDDTIQEAIRVVKGEIDRQAARRTDEANVRLVEMENQAFRWIRQGEQDRARTILFSREYQEQKRIYAEGMEDYAVALTRVREETRRSNRNLLLAYVTVMALAILVISALWIMVARRVRARDAYMRSIMEAAADTIITVDEDGTILTCNQAAESMFGHPGRDLVGMDLNLILPGCNGTQDGERVAVRSDGSTFPVHIMMSEIRLNNRRIFTGIMRDMTERIRIVTELEDRNSELERFAYAVSHDLKAPLVTINGFLDRLRESSGPEAGRDIDRISRATDTMALRLEDLLELSRIGRKANPPTDVPLTEVAREAVDLLEGRIKEQGVDVHIEEKLPVVEGDRARLLEVYQNLIENSVKYLGDKPHPRIEVGMRRSNGEAVFFVEDNGVGIPTASREKVFQVFERLHSDGEGTGLGLALVKRIIEVHGGRIWIESPEEGQGCSVCFTLPPKKGNGNE